MKIGASILISVLSLFIQAGVFGSFVDDLIGDVESAINDATADLLAQRNDDTDGFDASFPSLSGYGYCALNIESDDVKENNVDSRDNDIGTEDKKEVTISIEGTASAVVTPSLGIATTDKYTTIGKDTDVSTAISSVKDVTTVPTTKKDIKTTIISSDMKPVTQINSVKQRSTNATIIEDDKSVATITKDVSKYPEITTIMYNTNSSTKNDIKTTIINKNTKPLPQINSVNQTSTNTTIKEDDKAISTSTKDASKYPEVTTVMYNTKATIKKDDPIGVINKIYSTEKNIDDTPISPVTMGKSNVSDVTTKSNNVIFTSDADKANIQTTVSYSDEDNTTDFNTQTLKSPLIDLPFTTTGYTQTPDEDGTKSSIDLIIAESSTTNDCNDNVVKSQITTPSTTNAMQNDDSKVQTMKTNDLNDSAATDVGATRTVANTAQKATTNAVLDEKNVDTATVSSITKAYSTTSILNKNYSTTDKVGTSTGIDNNEHDVSTNKVAIAYTTKVTTNKGDATTNEIDVVNDDGPFAKTLISRNDKTTLYSTTFSPNTDGATTNTTNSSNIDKTKCINAYGSSTTTNIDEDEPTTKSINTTNIFNAATIKPEVTTNSYSTTNKEKTSQNSPITNNYTNVSDLTTTTKTSDGVFGPVVFPETVSTTLSPNKDDATTISINKTRSYNAYQTTIIYNESTIKPVIATNLLNSYSTTNKENASQNSAITNDSTNMTDLKTTTKPSDAAFGPVVFPETVSTTFISIKDEATTNTINPRSKDKVYSTTAINDYRSSAYTTTYINKDKQTINSLNTANILDKDKAYPTTVASDVYKTNEYLTTTPAYIITTLKDIGSIESSITTPNVQSTANNSVVNKDTTVEQATIATFSDLTTNNAITGNDVANTNISDSTIRPDSTSRNDATTIKLDVTKTPYSTTNKENTTQITDNSTNKSDLTKTTKTEPVSNTFSPNRDETTTLTITPRSTDKVTPTTTKDDYKSSAYTVTHINKDKQITNSFNTANILDNDKAYPTTVASYVYKTNEYVTTPLKDIGKNKSSNTPSTSFATNNLVVNKDMTIDQTTIATWPNLISNNIITGNDFANNNATTVRPDLRTNNYYSTTKQDITTIKTAITTNSYSTTNTEDTLQNSLITNDSKNKSNLLTTTKSTDVRFGPVVFPETVSTTVSYKDDATTKFVDSHNTDKIYKNSAANDSISSPYTMNINKDEATTSSIATTSIFNKGYPTTIANDATTIKPAVTTKSYSTTNKDNLSGNSPNTKASTNLTTTKTTDDAFGPVVFPETVTTTVPPNRDDETTNFVDSRNTDKVYATTSINDYKSSDYITYIDNDKQTSNLINTTNITDKAYPITITSDATTIKPAITTKSYSTTNEENISDKSSITQSEQRTNIDANPTTINIPTPKYESDIDIISPILTKHLDLSDTYAEPTTIIEAPPNKDLATTDSPANNEDWTNLLYYPNVIASNYVNTTTAQTEDKKKKKYNYSVLIKYLKPKTLNDE